jgi:hypothetical protein
LHACPLTLDVDSFDTNASTKGYEGAQVIAIGG